jgi:dTDP-4-dehydrorhamnose reductase
LTDGQTHRVLVTGASGILGDALLRSGTLDDAIGVVHRGSSEHEVERADLRDPAEARRVLEATDPDVVVHTVALTDVDLCEREPAEAFATAVTTTGNIATWLRDRRSSATLVFVSSDQVYSGAGPHGEERTAPLNVYGVSKRAGELAAAQAPRHLVLRTNFFGASCVRPSYTDFIAGRIRAGEVVTVQSEARFSALHLVDLVGAVAEALDQGLEGTFNVGSTDSMAKLEFVRRVAALAAPGGEELVHVADGSPAVPRPLDLALDVTRFQDASGRRLPTFADGLERVSVDLGAHVA